jgi:hypothetical protein
MIHHDAAALDDIRLVITNLKRLEKWIDLDRYAAPLHIRKDWDWLRDQVVHLLEALEKRESATPTRTPEPPEGYPTSTTPRRLSDLGEEDLARQSCSTRTDIVGSAD